MAVRVLRNVNAMPWTLARLAVFRFQSGVSMEKMLTARNTAIVVSVMALWRLYLTAELQLHPDEAYYWLWSRYLDIGYFDHPPVVAYFIWISTLFSQSELWVRFSGTVVLVILSGLMWRLALQLFKSVPVAAGSVMLFNVVPLTVLGMVVITPDIPVIFFWSLGTYLFWQIMRSQQVWLWYPLGLTFGLALLSKYTAVLMIPCFFAYLALSDDRRWLKTPHPYLALMTGLSCFLPVIFWNSRNDWVSFVFQMKNGLGGEDFSANKVAEYIAGQLLVSGPVVWIVGIYAAVAGWCRRDKATLLLICTAIPVILFFGFSSFRKVAGPNWPAFAYFSFCILVSKYCLEGYSKVRRYLWSSSVVSSLALSLVVTAHARFNLIPLAHFSETLASADATNWFHGWRELGTELKNYPDQKLAVTPSHQLSAEIMYYTDSKISAQTAKLSRPSQFNMWDSPRSPNAMDGLYVWTNLDLVGPDGGPFLAPRGSRTLNAYRDGRIVRTYHIISDKKMTVPPLLEY